MLVAAISTVATATPDFEVGPSFSQQQLLDAILARRRNITGNRKLSLRDWLNSVNATDSLVVQVGANDHAQHYHNADPAPKALNRGWRGLLLEPVPQLFARLRERYANHTSLANGRLRLLNAVVCDHKCSQQSQKFWSVDTSNSTGNWGKQFSDARCTDYEKARWVTEIASLNKQHVLGQGTYLRVTESICSQCAAKLGHPLPGSCLRNVVRDNIVSNVVPCACLATELRDEQDVALLVIDAEGHDYEVLRQYPFDRIHTARVVFESMHLYPASKINEAASLLMRHGFVNIMGGLGRVPFSMWHNMHSRENWKRGNESSAK